MRGKIGKERGPNFRKLCAMEMRKKKKKFVMRGGGFKIKRFCVGWRGGSH